MLSWILGGAFALAISWFLIGIVIKLAFVTRGLDAEETAAWSRLRELYKWYRGRRVSIREDRRLAEVTCRLEPSLQRKIISGEVGWPEISGEINRHLRAMEYNYASLQTALTNHENNPSTEDARPTDPPRQSSSLQNTKPDRAPNEGLDQGEGSDHSRLVSLVGTIFSDQSVNQSADAIADGKNNRTYGTAWGADKGYDSIIFRYSDRKIVTTIDSKRKVVRDPNENAAELDKLIHDLLEYPMSAYVYDEFRLVYANGKVVELD